MNKPLFRADLHCHSTCSDGTDSPEELVRRAVEIGLSGLSITDHDTIEAYKTAQPLAKELGLPLLSGCEFSAQQRGSSVHILAYAFDLDNPRLRAFCQTHHERREERYHAICAKLEALGLKLPPEETAKGTALGRPHIAKRLMDAAYVRSVPEAFSMYLGDERRCYVPSSACSVEETLDVIRSAGGLAVIAHPMLIKRGAVVRDLLAMDFDGIEGHYARFPKEKEHKWIRKGEERGWIVTGGSDYHGTVKPHIHLGSSWVQEEVFERLWTQFQQTH